MSYLLSDFLTDVNTRVNNEDGTVTPSLVTRYVNESLRRVRRKFDLPSAEVITQTALFSGVYQYGLPYTGFKDFVALRGNYQPFDDTFFRNVSEDSFWSSLQTGNTKSETRNGTSRGLLLNLVSPPTSSLTVNPASGSTTFGTWAASGDANTAGTDTLFFREGTSSLSFNITAATGTATLTNSTQTAIDISGTAFLNTGMLTAWIYLPSSTGFTGMTLRWGSSASKYWTSTVTTQIDGSAFVSGWNQLGFDWITATSVGSPSSTDAAAITYVLFSMVFPVSIGNQTGLRLNDITVRQRRLFNLHSTTDFLVVDGPTLTPKEQFASSTDSTSYFNVDRSFTDYFLYETLEQIFTAQINDPDARAFYATKRQELEQDLVMRYPSKRQPEMQISGDTSIHDAWLRRGSGR